MVTDDQGTQILKRMDEKFKGMDDTFNEVSRRMDAGFKRMDRRFEEVDQRFEAVNQRFGAIDEKLERIEMFVAKHDNTFKTLVTSEEFDGFKKEDMLFKYKVVKKLEDIEEAVKDSKRFERRLDCKINKHEQALKRHHLLEPVAT